MKKINCLLLIFLSIGLGGCSSRTDIGQYASKYSEYYKKTTYSFQYNNLFELIVNDDNTINYKELEKIVQEPESLEKTVRITENEYVDKTEFKGNIFFEITEEGKILDSEGEFAGELYNYNNEISQDPFYISNYSFEGALGPNEEPRAITMQDILYFGMFLIDEDDGNVFNEMSVSHNSISFYKRPEAGNTLDAEYQEQYTDQLEKGLKESAEIYEEEIPDLIPR